MQTTMLIAFGIYFILLLSIGLYFYNKNKKEELNTEINENNKIKEVKNIQKQINGKNTKRKIIKRENCIKRKREEEKKNTSDFLILIIYILFSCCVFCLLLT